MPIKYTWMNFVQIKSNQIKSNEPTRKKPRACNKDPIIQLFKTTTSASHSCKKASSNSTLLTLWYYILPNHAFHPYVLGKHHGLPKWSTLFHQTRCDIHTSVEPVSRFQRRLRKNKTPQNPSVLVTASTSSAKQSKEVKKKIYTDHHHVAKKGSYDSNDAHYSFRRSPLHLGN